MINFLVEIADTILFPCFMYLFLVLLFWALILILLIIIIVESFIRDIIIPMIPKYKRVGLVTRNKERTNYHVCVSYKGEPYHFYNKTLYDSAIVGDFLYVSICEKHNRLYIKNDGTVCKSSKKGEEKG